MLTTIATKNADYLWVKKKFAEYEECPRSPHGIDALMNVCCYLGIMEDDERARWCDSISIIESYSDEELDSAAKTVKSWLNSKQELARFMSHVSDFMISGPFPSMVSNMSIGLIGEIAEFAMEIDAIKKDGCKTDPVVAFALIGEAGDILFYAQALKILLPTGPNPSLLDFDMPRASHDLDYGLIAAIADKTKKLLFHKTVEQQELMQMVQQVPAAVIRALKGALEELGATDATDWAHVCGSSDGAAADLISCVLKFNQEKLGGRGKPWEKAGSGS